MSKYKPGRELDALVAEKVMGWIDISDGYGHPTAKGPFKDCDCPSHSIQATEIPAYSIDISEAWHVVEKLRLTIIPDLPNKGEWHATLTGMCEDSYCDETCASSPNVCMAICLAGLRISGVDIEGDRR